MSRSTWKIRITRGGVTHLVFETADEVRYEDGFLVVVFHDKKSTSTFKRNIVNVFYGSMLECLYGSQPKYDHILEIATYLPSPEAEKEFEDDYARLAREIEKRHAPEAMAS